MQTFKKQYIINEKDKKTATLFPKEKYEGLLEDLHDITIVTERLYEPTITFGELNQRLRKDGLL
ncbi:MAG: hypothetical protein WAW23_03470 [Candidatus Methanoperedens sp.]